jgi:transcriptional accessory protein Tex/SPT6
MLEGVGTNVANLRAFVDIGFQQEGLLLLYEGPKS